jgi:type II secretory pathway pseudopilin PulG
VNDDQRDGFALVAALVAVILLGALIAGAFVASTEESRVSLNAELTERSLNAAESAAEGDAAGWAAQQSDSLLVGQRKSRSWTADGMQLTTTLIRLNGTLFLLSGEATGIDHSASGVPMIRRRIGILLRRLADSTGHGSLLRLEERAWSELF